MDIGHDGAEIPSTHVGLDADATMKVFMLDDVRRRPDADVGHLLQLHVPTARFVDRQLANRRQTGARFGDAPHIHVVCPVGNVNVAGLFEGHQGGRRPPDVAGLEAMRERLVEIDLDVDLRDVLMEFHVQVDDAVDSRQSILHLRSELLEDVHVVAIDSDDDGLGVSGQHLPDSLLQVGLHVAIEAGIAVHRLLNFRHRLVVVDRGIDADPILPEIDADHFIHDQGLPDVGTEVADARYAPQLFARLNGDPVHFRPGGTGLGQPVHQEVPLLE